MAAQKGSDFLLKVGDGVTPTEGFTTIGGFRSNSFSINNESVDITSKDSNGVRELMSGGIQSMSASGSGVFMDDASFATAEAAARGNSIGNWQIIVPDYGTYEGPFHMSSLEYGGEHNGEATYSISLESAGAVTFTAAA